MSSRIGELADQAHEYALEVYHKRIETEAQIDVFFYQIRDDKFADLIVRECIDIITSEVEQNRQEDRYQMNAGDVRYTLEMQNAFAEKIQQHFGVER